MNKKEIEFINKIIELKPSLENKINSFRDTIAHQAPEIRNKVYWRKIHLILSTSIVIDENDNNSNDRKIYDLYHDFINSRKTVNKIKK